MKFAPPLSQPGQDHCIFDDLHHAFSYKLRQEPHDYFDPTNYIRGCLCQMIKIVSEKPFFRFFFFFFEPPISLVTDIPSHNLQFSPKPPQMCETVSFCIGL